MFKKKNHNFIDTKYYLKNCFIIFIYKYYKNIIYIFKF